ncbi:carbohydrate kinase family protein, partial [Candidatus Saccharibacteria bacterium]|nr:carbohydrate kinase family protein [Candidatus Saccharibacteria bacterium]
STGGGATNAAVTFARQRLHASFMGQIADDAPGRAVLDDLHREQVDTGSIIMVDDKSTGYSVILVSPKGERTVLTYRGASHYLDSDKFDFSELHNIPDWIYISSLSGHYEIIDKVIMYAHEHGIKVAINPGKGELTDVDRMRYIIGEVDLVSLNKEEMQQLYEGSTPEELVRAAIKDCPVVIVTDGPNGEVAASRLEGKLVVGGMYEDVPVVDRLGAGDAFSSGFTCRIAQGEGLVEAVKFAAANSTSVVTKMGAKTGILHEDTVLHDMPLEVKDL